MARGIVVIYMYDLIVSSKDDKEGLDELRTVLEVTCMYGLQLELMKCQFLKRKVEFLGYTVEDNAIHPSNAKIRKKFQYPTNVKQVQRCLGLPVYLRKFIPG